MSLLKSCLQSRLRIGSFGGSSRYSHCGGKSYSSNIISKPYDDDLSVINQLLDSSPYVLHSRAETLRRVKATIQKTFGEKYDVEIFGGVRYGVSSPQSDLDMVILDPTRPYGVSPELSVDLPGIYDVRRLARVLRKDFSKVIPRPFGSVPIVRFMDPGTRTNCDINVNDRLGPINSALISQYCDILPILRPMLMTIKLWAKPLGLNSPSERNMSTTFSSYAFALMTIAFLQSRGLLPNLQDGLPPMNDQENNMRVCDRRTSMQCDVRYRIIDKWRPVADISFLEAMQDWFHYWGHEYVYSPTRRISIRHGGLVIRGSELPGSFHPNSRPITPASPEIAKCPPDLAISAQENGKEFEKLDAWGSPTSKRERYSVFVVDPFILTKNVAGGVGHLGLTQFQTECRSALSALERNRNLRAVIPTLSNYEQRGTRARINRNG